MRILLQDPVYWQKFTSLYIKSSNEKYIEYSKVYAEAGSYTVPTINT
jgi:hypothetical protein